MPFRVAYLIPAYNAGTSVGDVVADVFATCTDEVPPRVIVVDDGSTDDTASVAETAGAQVVRAPRNEGKGAALTRGMQAAAELGVGAVVTLDADRQHFAREALRLARSAAPREALVLGVRDMASVGAPRAAQRSNKISNFFLGMFSGAALADSQCGLRRYPIPETLHLGVRDPGFAFESEVILRARHAGWDVVEVPVEVHYPSPEERIAHFHVVRDPARIVARVVKTLALMRVGR